MNSERFVGLAIVTAWAVTLAHWWQSSLNLFVPSFQLVFTRALQISQSLNQKGFMKAFFAFWQFFSFQEWGSNLSAEFPLANHLFHQSD